MNADPRTRRPAARVELVALGPRREWHYVVCDAAGVPHLTTPSLALALREVRRLASSARHAARTDPQDRQGASRE